MGRGPADPPGALAGSSFQYYLEPTEEGDGGLWSAYKACAYDPTVCMTHAGARTGVPQGRR